MKERLVIKNFGPIKNVELELGRFNVLIGENATGKSIVANVMAVCRYFSYILDDTIFEVNNHLFEDSFEEGLVSWGLNEYIQSDSFILYECSHYSFTANRTVRQDLQRNDQDGTLLGVINIPVFQVNLKPLSEEFENLLKELNTVIPKQAEDSYFNFDIVDWIIPTSFFQNDVAGVLDNPFYVPTKRGLQSIFSLGKNSIQNLSDALFNQLAELDQIARTFKKEIKIEPLRITYKNENGRGYIKKDTDDKYYSLFNAASGYQATIPVVLLMKYYNI